jgi:heme exporter protein A
MITPVSLKCENLEKRFLSKIIFSGVNFTLNTGSSIAVTGRNGSGKSTLLKIISNLIKQNKGKIILTVSGKDITDEKRYEHLGMIAPYINLYDELTAFENLEFFYGLKCEDKGAKYKLDYISALFEKINLYNRRNDLVKNYSSGMKQRLKLGFAILNEPLVLLMDEPRTNLDREGIDLVYSVAEAQKSRGILIIATNESGDTRLCAETLNVESHK